ncbi:hypothetical protein [Campylobacter hyointestinalis]|uniref:Uncharacterized protein n=1 Tax=Campylobacter hyointestinalis subsp. hyointestinalis TaxID=91352 RepID=A0A9W5ANY6_CAMHY|nr:hypothetical protein [Campylobacter hyointestinalis]ANE33726.1 hypothetical protein CHL_0348 [Campylobacter hyointestinalis subsp. lawsonii CCUG 27631]RAZ58745.1 hypothetical protein CHL10071_09565 [Campylobacter hyointestinalis subsp. lawsonii]CUU76955.1 Uncharacterised protein [Campylobacter hyointestinalis subsp. hyointestinalis]CUU84608.1 Uncharacterised protein [Campylobacter hyointestinalis subsp. hyointestinalis]
MLYFCYKTTGLRINQHIIRDDFYKEITMKIKPEIIDNVNFVEKEVNALNDFTKKFKDDYGLLISFHPEYELVSGSSNTQRALIASKDGSLPSRVSIAISTKTKVILVSLLKDKFVYIPKFIKDKKIRLYDEISFMANLDERLFEGKKSVFKRDILPIITKAKELNSKLDQLKSKNKVVALCAQDYFLLE